MPVINVQDLKKYYGPIQAVKGVSFTADKGEVVGFLGPNGAGKSTVMRMLTCFLSPTAGTASVGGHDIRTDSLEVRKLAGYLPESNPVYNDMTTLDFLKFIAKVRGIPAAKRESAIARVLEICHLSGVQAQMLDTLSKGFRRRVGLAQALIHDPEVLILDEPTDGLDPNQKQEVRDMIMQMAPDKTIIISTHILEEVEAICNRAIVIHEGLMVADSTPDELRGRSRYHGAVALSVRGAADSIEKRLGEIGDVDHVERGAAQNGVCELMIFPRPGQSITRSVLKAAEAEGCEIENIHVERGRLDEVFRSITTSGGKRG
ncbi:ATP-binding cassette domain-containing protein [Candidatus Sumerlaeota bacterium]|nr:ATP-binding cassette domain-containing protein [Candidatus Sumerlaeota bacterium]